MVAEQYIDALYYHEKYGYPIYCIHITDVDKELKYLRGNHQSFGL